LKVDRWILYVQLGLIAAIAAWPVVELLIPSAPPVLTQSLVITIVGSAIVVIDLQLVALRRRIESGAAENAALATAVRPVSLAQALDLAFAGKRRVTSMRIFAVSSHHIQNLLPDNRIEHCQLLIHDGTTPTNSQVFRTVLDEVVENWIARCDSGRCGRLSLRRFDFLPQVYLVAVDHEIVIVGTYDPREEEFSGVWPNEPLVFSSQSVIGRDIVMKWCDWFDAIFEKAFSDAGPNSWYLDRADQPSPTDVYPPQKALDRAPTEE
jgi:uncharacterized membrane protein YeaQ/YmgE (transglycosylase-associated protein family)